VKLKQTDYIDLHRLVTGLNARVVWERLGLGETEQQICEPLPDELHPWVEGIAGDLMRRQVDIITAARREHAQIKASLPEGWTRKDYAAVASKSEHRAWLFMLLDGKDPAAKIWRTLRPSGEDRPVNITEDTA
jgi:RNA ligase